MRKIKIRCYKILLNDYPDAKDFPVYYFAYDGWSHYSFSICLQCGELFVINWENPKTKGMSTVEIAHISRCPTCNSFLRDTLKDYPRAIKFPNGKIGTFTPSQIIPPDEDSLIMEVFEIIPK